MIMDGNGDSGYVGDGSRGDWRAIDNLDVSGRLEGKEWELVVAGEVFINKGDASCSTVNQGTGANGLVTEEDSARDNKMLSFC